MKNRELIKALQREVPDAEVQVVVLVAVERRGIDMEEPLELSISSVYDDSLLTTSQYRAGEMVTIQMNEIATVGVSVAARTRKELTEINKGDEQCNVVRGGR